MYRIGVDLGGTNIAVGLVNEHAELLLKKSCPTGADRPGEQIVDDIAALCLAVCQESGVAKEEIESVGIASPGIANSETGVVEYANNLPFRQFPVSAAVSFSTTRSIPALTTQAASWVTSSLRWTALPAPAADGAVGRPIPPLPLSFV